MSARPRSFSRRPVVVIRRRPWGRMVPVVRGLAGRGWPQGEIARRLGMSRRRVCLALSEGAGIWSPAEVARMRTVMTMERGR